TTIKFSLKDESMVNLNVYNYSGQLVKSLANEIRERGFHKIEFNASQFSSGVYYYTLKTDTKTFTKKMLMVK
ncbi:MAG: T9SS type A sorting domain-containing protein, partial [Candidatus Delongbacteria bacterium]|nr:T9SS type A sorting domain-containing protein [Candidatus Delongbacteria bacterium]